MTTFATENPWGSIGADLAGKRSPVIAVVSFVGAAAGDLMPLGPGDTLICNADEATIRLGLTNVKALQQFAGRGVDIYAVPHLHAKVVVGADFAWVGSANASDSGLLEATIRVGKTASHRVRRWAEDLCQDVWQLDDTQLLTLSKIPVKRGRGLSAPRRQDLTLDEVRRLWLVWLAGEATAEMEQSAELEETQQRASRRRRTDSRWQWIALEDEHQVRPTDWIIPFYNGRPSRPGRVEKVTAYPAFDLVWFRVSATPRIPRQTALADAVPRWWDWNEEEPLLINREASIRKVLDLYS